MKSHTFLILGVVVLLAGGAWYFSARQGSQPEKYTIDISVQPTIVVTPGEEKIIEESRYIVYSKIAFDAAADKKRVLFFHAPWCPTCRPADASFQQNADAIPEDVVLFKTDYDSSTDLKKQYSITYQHTYVLVDDTGREIKKWNGGGIDELVTNTK